MTPPDENPTTLREHLGNAAAELLSEIVTPDDVLGLAWSRSVSAMTNALNRLPAIPVVQLTGALVQPDTADSSVDVVRQAARISGGAAHFFFAPTVVPDPATANALRKQPEVARTFGRIGSVTKAVVGVGLWAPGESTVYDVTDKKVQRELHQRGVCGEIAGVLIDANGHPAESDLTERMIGISAAQLRAIPEVIGLAYGIARSPAVQAAVRGGFIKSLVTLIPGSNPPRPTREPVSARPTGKEDLARVAPRWRPSWAAANVPATSNTHPGRTSDVSRHTATAVQHGKQGGRSWVDRDAGVRIGYTVVEPATDPLRTVLLIHGAPQTGYAWRKVAPLLAEAGYRVVVPDDRGAGASTKPRDGYDKWTMAGDLHHLVHSELGIDGQISVVGHDLGSMLGFAYALRPSPGGDQLMITLPMTPVAESSPITVNTRVAAIALPTHSRRPRPAPRAIHPSAPNPSPSSRNHGSLKNRSCRSAVRWSIEAHTVAGYSMRSSPARLRTRWMMSIKACMLQPTATSQHTASSTARAPGLRHKGSTATGNTAATMRITTAAALMRLNCVGSAGVPGSKSVPPSA